MTCPPTDALDFTNGPLRLNASKLWIGQALVSKTGVTFVSIGDNAFVKPTNSEVVDAHEALGGLNLDARGQLAVSAQNLHGAARLGDAH